LTPSSKNPSGAVQVEPSLAGFEVTQVSQEAPSLQVPHTDIQVPHWSLIPSSKKPSAQAHKLLASLSGVEALQVEQLAPFLQVAQAESH
jgi:hypothetical protein